MDEWREAMEEGRLRREKAGLLASRVMDTSDSLLRSQHTQVVHERTWQRAHDHANRASSPAGDARIHRVPAQGADWPGARAESHAEYFYDHKAPARFRLDRTQLPTMCLHSRQQCIQELDRGQLVSNQLAALKRGKSKSTHHGELLTDQELEIAFMNRQSLVENVMRLDHERKEALRRAEKAEARASMLEAQAIADFDLLFAAQMVREEIKIQNAAEMDLMTSHVRTWMHIALEAQEQIAAVRADIKDLEHHHFYRKAVSTTKHTHAEIAKRLKVCGDEVMSPDEISQDEGLQLLLFFAQNTSLISSTLGRLFPPGSPSPLPSRNSSPSALRGHLPESDHNETFGRDSERKRERERARVRERETKGRASEKARARAKAKARERDRQREMHCTLA